MFPLRCASRSIRLATRPLASHPKAFPPHRRSYADQSRTPPTRYQPDPDAGAENVQNQFAEHAMTAFKDMRKVMLFIAYGTLIVGTVTCAAFEAAHFWIERSMCERADDDARRWDWEVESWSDVRTGGTSSDLGFVGRHAVRAAWFSLRYGKHFRTTATISQVAGGAADQGSLNIVDASLESARVYLEKGMERVRDDQGRVRVDSVGLELLERHASIMERLGTHVALAKARDEYIQVMHGRAGQRLAEARLAVKIGDLSERMGDGKGALSWWMRGIDLTIDESTLPTSPTVQPRPSHNSQLPAVTSLLRWTQGQKIQANDSVAKESAPVTNFLPVQPPSTPAAQRTLIAAMVSLSAYYSKRKQLHEAKSIQEQALRLIDAMVPQHEASSAARPAQSPAQTLHHMYLLHRKSLLGLHHGEVTFALASSTPKTGKTAPHSAALMYLLGAASSSEVVAQILSGLSLSHPDVPTSYLGTKEISPSATRIPHPPSSNSPLQPAYRDSPALNGPAASVLRDARLVAATAWDLCGVLYSGTDENAKALECFERALGWVGDDPAESGSREGMGAKEWQGLWARYVVARDKVLRKPK